MLFGHCTPLRTCMLAGLLLRLLIGMKERMTMFLRVTILGPRLQ